MPLSTHNRNHKFLLDENVKRKLYIFLKSKSYDVKVAPTSASDAQLAALSKTENRILVTNDEDFIEYTQEYVFSIVWLRTPQADTKKLLYAFEKLLEEFTNFLGRFVIVKEDGWHDFDLGEELKLK